MDFHLPVFYSGDINLPVFIIGCLYMWEVNQFFGHNWNPKSAAEVIADGIGVLIMALSVIY